MLHTQNGKKVSRYRPLYALDGKITKLRLMSPKYIMLKVELDEELRGPKYYDQHMVEYPEHQSYEFVMPYKSFENMYELFKLKIPKLSYIPSFSDTKKVNVPVRVGINSIKNTDLRKIYGPIISIGHHKDPIWFSVEE